MEEQLPVSDPFLLALKSIDWPAIRDCWPGVLPQSCELLGLSLFGDIFVRAESGLVFIFKITSGKLNQIAHCSEEFEWDLSQADKRTAWLMQPLAEAATAAGMVLEVGECLAFQTPPMLNGKLHPSNLVCLDLLKYHQGLSKLFPQLRDLSLGTRVVPVVIRPIYD